MKTMDELLPLFTAAARIGTTDALEGALKEFKRLPEVKANAEIGPSLAFKTIKPLGVALGKALSGKPHALRCLNRLAGDDKAAVRSLACYVLGEIGKGTPEAIVPAAHKLAADDRWEVRECIANAFDDQVGVAQPEFVYELMAQWVSDPSPRVRRVPTNALMRYGIKHPRPVIALMDRLRHEADEYVRKNVRFCLQQIAKEKHPVLGPGHPDNPDVMLAALREWAKDPDKYNRWIVAGTLGNVWARGRIPQALALLKALAADGDRLVRGAVVAAMRELSKHDPPAIAAAARKWCDDEDENVRAVGETVFRKIG